MGILYFLGLESRAVYEEKKRRNQIRRFIDRTMSFGLSAEEAELMMGQNMMIFDHPTMPYVACQTCGSNCGQCGGQIGFSLQEWVEKYRFWGCAYNMADRKVRTNWPNER